MRERDEVDALMHLPRERDDLRTGTIASVGGILFGETGFDEGGDQTMRGTDGESQVACHLGHADLAGFREMLENTQRVGDGAQHRLSLM